MLIKYRNWKGNTRVRRLNPLYLKWDVNSLYGDEPRYLLTSVDAESGDVKDFALEGLQPVHLGQVLISGVETRKSDILFLDTEFNGHGGALLSLALVPLNTNFACFYGEIDPELSPSVFPLNPWVGANVLPKMTGANRGDLKNLQLTLENYLCKFPNARIVCDHAVDIGYLIALLHLKPSYQECAYYTHQYQVIETTSPKPDYTHNALEDAKALREWYVQYGVQFYGGSFGGAYPSAG